ncbi:MAG: hypothetical protein KDD34_00620 [Bdellovibrionales bacterium]|nr:hypothetical protein [Bdellovibrionales bacterium]
MIFFRYLIHFFIFLSILPGLTACSLLQRHESSGYADAARMPAYYQLELERQAYKESFAREELGLGKGYNLSEPERVVLNKRLQLKKSEQNLTTDREKRQYYSYKPLMKNDDQRLYYLNLPSQEARERFVYQMGIAGNANEFTPDVADLIETNDIAVGMTEKAVLESWGDPDTVEVAGNDIYGNERWKYSKYVSSESGYRREVRYVYFENGVVSGWESF